MKKSRKTSAPPLAPDAVVESGRNMQLHQRYQPVGPLAPDNEAASFNLYALKMLAWLLYVAAELVFNDQVREPRYWKPVGRGGYAYDPSEAERDWFGSFAGIDAFEETTEEVFGLPKPKRDPVESYFRKHEQEHNEPASWF